MPEKVDRRDRRRVPEERRRRALASCDGCKGRRVKCQRNETDEACVSCVKAGITCQTTLPRKTRIYGSVESLSIRYRALDALVKGLFPDQDTADTKTLFRLAQERKIPMPDATDESAENDLFQGSSSVNKSDIEVELDLPDIFLPVAQSDNPFASRQPKLVDERLIPTPHGVAHYVGPSSSFKFAAHVRQMVARCTMLQDNQQLHRKTHDLRADFANMRISKALEPREAEDNVSDNASVATTGDTSASRITSPLNVFADPTLGNLDNPYSLLPARNVADALVTGFFDKVHVDFPLFHRSTFQQRYEQSWDPNIEIAQKPDIAWWCCLFMVFVLGAQALEEHDAEQSSHLQKRFIALARQRIQKLITTSSLQNVQALSLLMLYEHNSGERNTAWMMVGAAARMAISLGLHRDNTAHTFDSIERNIRRRVWWTLYIFEHELSVVLGRPSGIDDEEVFVGLPEETIIEAAGCPDILRPSIQLTQLQTRMRELLFPLPKHEDVVLSKNHINSTNYILESLNQWNGSLLQHLRPDFKSILPAHRRAVLMLQVRYHYTKSVAARPYLVLKAENDINMLAGQKKPYEQEAEARALSAACCSAAYDTVKCLLSLSHANLLNGTSWLDMYYAYHAVLIMCLDFLARPKDMPDSTDDTAHKRAIVEMSNVIRQTRLASTYHILGQVAVQFARIVGIVDVPGVEDVIPDQLATHGIIHRNSIPNQAPPLQPPLPPHTLMQPASTGQVLVPPPPVVGLAAPPIDVFGGPPQEAFNATGAVWDFFDMSNPEQAAYAINMADFPQAGTFGHGGGVNHGF